MKVKAKREKLGNSPYLSQEQILQSQYSSSIGFYKKNKLDNSMYSHQQTHQIIDYQAQNINLKQTIETIKSQYKANQAQLKQQIQAMSILLDIKQTRIQELERKISEFEKEVNQKNQNLRDKIIQCEQIVRQLQHQQLNTSTHNMLETSRISKFNILDQTNTLPITESHPFTPINPQNKQQPTDQPTFIPLSNQAQAMNQNHGNLATVKYHQTSDKTIFYQEKRDNYQESIVHQRSKSPGVVQIVHQRSKSPGVVQIVHQRSKSPGVVFKYTPQKIVTPMTPVYIPQRNILQVNAAHNNGNYQIGQNVSVNQNIMQVNATQNNGRPQMSQNRSLNQKMALNNLFVSPLPHSNNQIVYNEFVKAQFYMNNEYQNGIRRAQSSYNVPIGSKPFGNINYEPNNTLQQHK